MKLQVWFSKGLLAWVLLAGLGFGAVKCQGAAPMVLYTTGFEATEGFNISDALVDQNGWVSFGSGGNGLVDGSFSGGGQQAYLGYFAPTGNDDELSLWRPINFTPASREQQLITFWVRMSIEDSSAGNANYDDFRWSVYNTDNERLLSLDFENLTFRISYALDDAAGFVFTGETFTNSVIYDLAIQMDFAHNRWSAWLGDRLLVANQLITTKGAALTLGDVDAVWLIRTPGAAGNNYLLFDDILLTAEPAPVFPPTLDKTTRLPGGEVQFRVYGEPDFSYAIDASTNLVNWSALKTNSAPTGIFDFQDDSATNLARRFYRVRQLP